MVKHLSVLLNNYLRKDIKLPQLAVVKRQTLMGHISYRIFFTLDLSEIAPVDVVYILLSPDDSTVEGYQHTYVDSIEPIRQALKSHPVKRLIVVSSTRVYE